MAHKVKCIYCGLTFDRDKEPYAEVGARRYAHKACFDRNERNKSQAEKDYEALVNYIQKLYDIPDITAKIAKDIKDMREKYNYTYSGILGTLVYWYEERGASIDKANGGLGIVPYVYDQAKEYYQKIALANHLNERVTNYKWTVKEIVIEAPQPESRPPKLFNIEEDNE